MPLRVLHVLDTFESGGAQRVAIDLARWLRDHDVESTFIGDDGALVPAFAEVGTVILRPPRARSLTSQIAHLHDVVESSQPHLLHSHQRREALTAKIVGARFRVPTVEHAHTHLTTTNFKSLSYRSDHIFAVTDAVGTSVRDEFGRPAERITVTGNAPSHLPLVPPDRQNHPHSPLRVLGIGRLTDQKDPVRFVDTVAALSEHTAVTARWAGTGDLAASAADHIRRTGAPVELLGETDDIAAQLAWADVLLMTSKTEGLPLVLLEGMAHGVPVVSTRVGGIGDLLADDRGALVAADASPDAIARVVREVADDPAAAARRAQAAQDHIAATASPDTVFGPVLDVYRQIVNNSPALDGRRVSLHDVPIDLLSLTGAADRVEAAITEARAPYLVVTPNTDHFLRLRKDEDLLGLYESADLSVPDGMPLVAMLRASGVNAAERVTGVDLFFETCRRLSLTGGRLAIIGGQHGTATVAARALEERFPGLQVVFTAEPSPAELGSDAAVRGLAGSLRECSPDAVALCVGSPKQERLFTRLRDSGAPPAAYLCVGAAVDFAAGTLDRAPMVLQQAGLEWAYRLAKEPRRLWKRYLLNNTQVAPYVVRSMMHGRRQPL
jgi:exopolysaccharide biosynthesis WecB/TagA/CpsF family protein